MSSIAIKITFILALAVAPCASATASPIYDDCGVDDSQQCQLDLMQKKAALNVHQSHAAKTQDILDNALKNSQANSTHILSSSGLPESPVKYKVASTFKYHICDMKVAVAREHTKHCNGNRFTMENYKDLMDKLVGQVGINGLRMPMVPLYDDPNDYIDLDVHEAVYEYAQEKGMIVYASLMPGTTEGWIYATEWTDEKLVNFCVNYVKHFQYVHFLGPFNEPYYQGSDDVGVMQRIVPKIRDALADAGFGSIKLVGPDEVKIKVTIQTLEKNPDAYELFDVIGTHTQKEEMQGTVEGWQELISLAGGKPVWDTEGMTNTYDEGYPCSDPTEYDYCPAGTIRHPMKDGVEAGLQGWMHWAPTGSNGIIHAKTGEVKERGLAIAAAIVADQ